MYKDWSFALVADQTVAFDPTIHNRRDLPITKIRTSDSEDKGIVTLTLTVGTNVTGLGAADVGTAGLLSREIADGSIILICRGHLMTVPVRGTAEGGAVDIVFQCSPIDWAGAEAQLMANFSVLPQFDPVLCAKAERLSPREVLDGWYRTVHCDPRTLELQAVDKFGYGLPQFQLPNPWNEPGVRTRVTQVPVAAVQATLTCEFTQRGDGLLDLTTTLLNSTTYGQVDTLSPEQFEKSWPKAGAKVNGNSGWTYTQTTMRRLTADEVANFNVANPLPTQAGPFHGGPEKTKSQTYYSYVADRSLTVPYTTNLQDGTPVTRYSYVPDEKGNIPEDDPAGLLKSTLVYDRPYYDVKLSLGWSVRQKRRETVTFVLKNASKGVISGETRTLSLKCEDVQDNSSVQPWLPLTQYAVGDSRRVGLYEVECQYAHKSGTTWATDQTLTLQNGVVQELWTLLPNNSAPLADPAEDSYLKTPRGEQTAQCVLLKMRRILADSIRCNEVKVRHYLSDDLLLLTCGSSAVISAPPELLDGGTAWGKVTAVEIYSGQDDEYIDVTITCAAGTGAAFVADPVDARGNSVIVAGIPGRVNLLQQPWDEIQYEPFADFAVYPFPSITGKATITNGADDQTTYIQANDFILNDPVRGDDSKADPGSLLRAVPTSLAISLTQLSGYPTIEADFAPVVLGAWQGPRQYDDTAGG